MTYEYKCNSCEHSFDVTKNVKYMDIDEPCPKCGTICERIFRPKIHLSNTKVQDSYYNHGLGQVVKNDQHARQIAKEKGLIEVGNEKVEKHVKYTPKDYGDGT